MPIRTELKGKPMDEKRYAIDEWDGREIEFQSRYVEPQTVKIAVRRYTENQRPALILNQKSTGQRLLVASVNIEGAPISDSELLIKDYSENEGVLKALEAAGVVRATGRFVDSGYVSIPVVHMIAPS